MHPLLRDLETTRHIAHRGGAGCFPENTLVAFKGALALGADWLELDVHLSADGEVVVAHDHDLHRVGAVGRGERRAAAPERGWGVGGRDHDRQGQHGTESY